MYQNLVEGREVPWDLLVKNVPPERHRDLDYLVDVIDWERNTDPDFKAKYHLRPVPVADTAAEGYMDRWICYGRVGGFQPVTAKELTLQVGAKCTVTDKGAYGLITVQGHGRANGVPLGCPTLIRFRDLTEDEAFVAAPAAGEGVTFENTSAVEPLVVLRYFGPEVNPDAPAAGG